MDVKIDRTHSSFYRIGTSAPTLLGSLGTSPTSPSSLSYN